jgi:hypothetical protein
MKIRSAQDFWAGIMFVAIGLAALVLAQNYPVGTASRMGSGYFPLMLGAGIVTVGVILAGCGISYDGPPIERVSWRANFFIIASIATFGFLIEIAGLVLTVIITVFLSSLAHEKVRWREVAILSACLAALAIGLFKYVLAQPLSVWGLLWTS